MHADAAPLRSRLEPGWTGVIEKQEGADVVAVARVREERAHRKPVPDPWGRGAP